MQCNGYRKPLYESLRKRGNKVEFVGKTAAGDFEENLNEGHRGERIEEIQELSRTGIWAAPNIVLLHAGTNDVKDQKADYYKAHAQLRDMISLIYEKSPDALVFLCKIIPANPKNYHDTAAEIPNFNSGLIDIESHFKARSKKIVLVDMNSELDPGDLSDGLHPTTDGYGKMAAKFLEEIEKAQDDISKPIKGSKPPPSSTSPSNCRATPSWYKVGKIADGAKVYALLPHVVSSIERIILMLLLCFRAKPDGDFVQMWDEMEVLTDGFCKRDRVRFMDLDGDGLKDYACVDPDTGKTTVRKNKGKDGKMSTEWGEEEQVATGAKGRKGSGVMFAE